MLLGIHAWTRAARRLQRGDRLGDLVEMTGHMGAAKTENSIVDRQRLAPDR